MTPIILSRDYAAVDVDDDGQAVMMSDIPLSLKQAGVQSNLVTSINGLPAYEYIIQAEEQNKSAFELGVATEFVFDGDVWLTLVFKDDAATESNLSQDNLDLDEARAWREALTETASESSGDVEISTTQAEADKVDEAEEPSGDEEPDPRLDPRPHLRIIGGENTPAASNRLRLGLPARDDAKIRKVVEWQKIRRQQDRCVTTYDYDPLSWERIDRDHENWNPFAERA